MIECIAISTRAGNFELRDVTFTIPPGGHAVLTGPTASGKTTLLEVMAGAIAPGSGEIRISGENVTTKPAEERGIGFVPQHGFLFPHLDVRDNIRYGVRDGRDVADLASRFGITRLMDRSISSLSGGERQIVALCRALAPCAPVLLLDEPLSALDDTRRAAVLRELAALQTERRFTMLHVTHQATDAAFATHRLTMDDGDLEEEASGG